MLTFEVRKYIGGRWLLDTVFDDKSVAISEAKTLMERNSSLPGVRVVAVAEEELGSFREWTVYRQMIVDDEQALQRAFQLRHETAPAARGDAPGAKTPASRRLDWLDYTGWSLVALLVLGAAAFVLMMLSHAS